MLWMHTYVSEFAQLEMNGGKKQTKKDDILKINIDRKMTVMKCVNSNWMSMKRGKQILKSMLSPKMHKNQMKSTKLYRNTESFRVCYSLRCEIVYWKQRLLFQCFFSLSLLLSSISIKSIIMKCVTKSQNRLVIGFNDENEQCSTYK